MRKQPYRMGECQGLSFQEFCHLWFQRLSNIFDLVLVFIIFRNANKHFLNVNLYFNYLSLSSCPCSVLFSRSVVSDSLRPHELQHARPPCPSPTPGVHSNPCPLSRWCHPTISSSVVPFSSCPQSSPESGSFQMNQLFTSGGQNIGVSAPASVLPVNAQDWSPLG